MYIRVGLCVCVCVCAGGWVLNAPGAVIRLPILYAELTPGCGLCKLSVMAGVNAPHQKGCVSMRESSLCH